MRPTKMTKNEKLGKVLGLLFNFLFSTVFR